MLDFMKGINRLKFNINLNIYNTRKLFTVEIDASPKVEKPFHGKSWKQNRLFCALLY